MALAERIFASKKKTKRFNIHTTLSKIVKETQNDSEQFYKHTWQDRTATTTTCEVHGEWEGDWMALGACINKERETYDFFNIQKKKVKQQNS